jgi:phage-related baseplate assembly protein
MSADGAWLMRRRFSPLPAEVTISILARDGMASRMRICCTVSDALNDENVRPVGTG